MAQHLETLKTCIGLPIRELNFTDDRLSAILRHLNEEEPWQTYEQNQGKLMIRVYDLSTKHVRLDTTTASTY